MQGEAYEQYIADLYEEDGFNTSLTSRSADKGIDIFAEKDGKRAAVQCKHYSRGNKVSDPDIQKAAGLFARGDISNVVVVTTSSFTRPARDTARNRGVELQQIGYNPTPEPDNNQSNNTTISEVVPESSDRWDKDTKQNEGRTGWEVVKIFLSYTIPTAIVLISLAENPYTPPFLFLAMIPITLFFVAMLRSV